DIGPRRPRHQPGPGPAQRLRLHPQPQSSLTLIQVRPDLGVPGGYLRVSQHPSDIPQTTMGLFGQRPVVSARALSLCQQGHSGLVVLTGRFPFADLESFDGGTARMLEVPPFTAAEGSALLAATG